MKKIILAMAAVSAMSVASAVTFDLNAGGNINDVATNDFTFTVSGLGSVLDVNLRFSARHTWDSDIDLFLIAPNATMIEISTDNGSSGDNYQDTLFDDEAATSVTAGAAPFIGTFKSEGLLSGFDGINPNGTWTLRVIDDASADTGAVFKAGDAAPWGTAVGTQLIIEANPVPEPATLAVLGLGAAALIRRRRK